MIATCCIEMAGVESRTGVLVLVILLVQCLHITLSVRRCSNEFLHKIREERRTGRYCLPTDRCWPTQREFNDLRYKNPTLELILPNEVGWQEASNITLNLRVAKTPGAVVYVTSASDVQAVIDFVRTFHLDLKIISSGHELLGRNSAEGALLMSVVRMKSISTELDCVANPDGGCMTVEPGVTWSEAYQQADLVDRVIVGGVSLSVSVAGWVFGGGHSPITPKKGLGVDQLLEVEMVLSDGSVAILSDSGIERTYTDGKVETTTDTDLFYAVKGGGGGTFGVVTSLTYKLHIPPPAFSKFVCFFVDPAAGMLDGGENMFNTVNKAFLPLIERLPNEFGAYLTSTVTCLPNPPPAAGCTPIPAMIYDIPHWGPSSGKNKAYFDQLESLGLAFADFAIQGVSIPKLPGADPDKPCSILDFPSFNMMVRTSLVPPAEFVYWDYAGTLLQEGQLTMEHQENEAAILAEAFRQQKELLTTYVRIGGTSGQAAANSDVESSINPDFRTASYVLEFIGGRNAEQLKCEFLNSMNTMVRNPSKYFSEASNDLKPRVWRMAFWGENYRKLVQIKKKYDGQYLFTCVQCIGSDM